MFARFFYLMRERGMNVSLDQWMTLIDGMARGLHRSTLTGFYHLCRAILIKNETEFDRFDQIFLEFFKDVPWKGELPDDLLDWLNSPAEDLRRTIEQLRELGFPDESLEQLLKMLEERIEEQDDEHNGGNYWVGTQGTSPFGNSGWHPNGIRVGGKSMHRTAMMVAGERRYRDFRKDNTLDTRQFQVAFRTLRQLSVRTDTSDKELDVDGTVRDTCDNAGTLSIRYRRPRKNTIKVILLMDSGGSMDYYSGMCSMLFQAATKSNNFKELHTFYFHNCVYANLYKDPRLVWTQMMPTEEFLKKYDSSYKVIFVGDAAMNPYELTSPQYNIRTRDYSMSGYDWLTLFKKKYPSLIWLNPEPIPERASYWGQTSWQISQLFKMFRLSAEGLEDGMKQLMKTR